MNRWSKVINPRSGAATAFLCLAQWAMGQPVVTMQLTGPPPGPSMAGVYTSPYAANINGVSSLVICDDFTTDVSTSTPAWQAYVTSMPNLPTSAVKFDDGSASQQETDYATAALLAEEIMTQDQSTQAGQYQAGVLSYALWGLFYTPLLTSYQVNCTSNHSYGCLTSQELTDATNALSYAEGHAGSYLQYSNVNIFTPEPNKGVSQEYMTVSTPEPSAFAFLTVYLATLVGLFFLLKRRIGYTHSIPSKSSVKHPLFGDSFFGSPIE